MGEPFSVVAGDAASACVLHVPHASTEIPAEQRARILLDDAALAAELRVMTDAHTDLVAARASGLAARSPWQFVHRLSRLVIDPERFIEPDAEEMEAVGMGAVYTATHDGQRLRHDDPRHRVDLLAAYFTPYVEALADLVDQRLAARDRAVIVDVHSYPAKPLPYERHAELRRPEICLGVDERHTPGWLRHAAEAAFAGFDLAINAPFLGTYVPTRHYQRDLRVASIMIEIRRDLYLGAGGEPLELGVRKLASALATLVDAIDASDSAAKARRVPLPPIPVGATKEETKRTLGTAIRELFDRQAGEATKSDDVGDDEG